MRCLFESHAVSFLAMKMEWEEELKILAQLSNCSQLVDLESVELTCVEYERADSPKEHISRGFKTDH